MRMGMRMGVIRRFATRTDIALVTVGSVGALADGMSLPLFLVCTSGMLTSIAAQSQSAKFMHSIHQYALYYIYIAVAVWAAAFLEAFCWTKAAERLCFRLRMEYLRSVLSQGIDFFDNSESDDARNSPSKKSKVISSLSADSEAVREAISEKVPSFLMNISAFVCGYGASVYLCWRVALPCLPVVAALIAPGMLYGRTLMAVCRRAHNACKHADSIVERVLGSVKTVYAFGGEAKALHGLEMELQQAERAGVNHGLAKGFAVGSNALVFAIWAFLAWYGSRLVLFKNQKPGRVFTGSLSLVQASLSLGSALPNIKQMTEALVAVQEMAKVIVAAAGEAKHCRNKSHGAVKKTLRGEIAFSEVNFAYPSRPQKRVLNRLNLTIPAGHTVGIVGGSGCGKSTVMALLQRFYAPQSGDITVDGQSIRSLNVDWWRRQIGVVSQEPALFAISILDNILLASTVNDSESIVSMEEAVAAAKAADADDFINELPQGYHTHVGEGGVQLSGGQRQRIAIARALIRNPRVLLLDEATSALDSECECRVLNAFGKGPAGRTTIVIAHRLCAVRNAHSIAVLQDGRLVETGSHQQLIDNVSGVYRAMWDAQLQGPFTVTDAHSAGQPSAAVAASSLIKKNTAPADDSPIQTKSFMRVVGLNSQERKHAVSGTLCALMSGSVQPVYAYILGTMISALFLASTEGEERVRDRIRYCATVFSALSLLSLSTSIIQHLSFAVMGESLAKRIRVALLSKMLTFEIAWFDKQQNSSAGIVARVASETNAVKSVMAERTSILVQAFSGTIVATALASALAWQLALVMMAVQPLTILCFYTRKVLLTSISANSRSADSRGCQIAGEAVSNHRTVTALACKDKILTMYDSTQNRQDGRSRWWLAGVGIATAQSVTYMTWALDFWWGGKLVQKGLITSEDVFRTFFIMVSTGRVIAEAGSMASDLAKGSTALESILGILNRRTVIDPDEMPRQTVDAMRGDIEFREVDFAYPTRPTTPILKKLSLRIKGGTSTALVGHSGSGKSTIVSLLERFYEPQAGQISVGGVELPRLNVREMRKHIAWVGQEIVVFSGMSLRENILYGNPEASEAELLEASIAANAHSFILGLEGGYSSKGVELSGGQKQRIGIARALVRRDACVVLLDEASSALDSLSEKALGEAMTRLVRTRKGTAVIVAHRLSTVASAESIAVVCDGRIVEQGNLRSLLDHGGAFARLFASQSHSNFVATCTA